LPLGEGLMEPRRSIVYTVWDGEDRWLAGSTELGRDAFEEFQKACGGYIQFARRKWVGDSSRCAIAHSEHFANETRGMCGGPSGRWSVAVPVPCQLMSGRSGKRHRKRIRNFDCSRVGSDRDFQRHSLQHWECDLSLGFGGEDASNGVSPIHLADSYDRYTKLSTHPDCHSALRGRSWARERTMGPGEPDDLAGPL